MVSCTQNGSVTGPYRKLLACIAIIVVLQCAITSASWIDDGYFSFSRLTSNSDGAWLQINLVCDPQISAVPCPAIGAPVELSTHLEIIPNKKSQQEMSQVRNFSFLANKPQRSQSVSSVSDYSSSSASSPFLEDRIMFSGQTENCFDPSRNIPCFCNIDHTAHWTVGSSQYQYSTTFTSYFQQYRGNATSASVNIQIPFVKGALTNVRGLLANVAVKVVNSATPIMRFETASEIEQGLATLNIVQQQPKHVLDGRWAYPLNFTMTNVNPTYSNQLVLAISSMTHPSDQVFYASLSGAPCLINGQPNKVVVDPFYPPQYRFAAKVVPDSTGTINVDCTDAISLVYDYYNFKQCGLIPASMELGAIDYNLDTASVTAANLVLPPT